MYQFFFLFTISFNIFSLILVLPFLTIWLISLKYTMFWTKSFVFVVILLKTKISNIFLWVLNTSWYIGHAIVLIQMNKLNIMLLDNLISGIYELDYLESIFRLRVIVVCDFFDQLVLSQLSPYHLTFSTLLFFFICDLPPPPISKHIHY